MLACLLLTGCGQSSSGATTTYGGFPSFLPPQTLTAGSHLTVDASAARPALATQGDEVRVHLSGAIVLVRVVGPQVPVSGLAHQSPSTPATWTITMSSATAPVDVRPAAFQAVDEAGQVRQLRVLQPRPAATLRPGATVTFRLFAPAFPTGEGRLRWIPSGHLAPVEWDFIAETD